MVIGESAKHNLNLNMKLKSKAEIVFRTRRSETRAFENKRTIAQNYYLVIVILHHLVNIELFISCICAKVQLSV